MGLSVRTMAKALGVSKSQVARDAAAGMPMESAESARAWREAQHDLSRTAEGRIDRVPVGVAATPEGIAPDGDDAPEADADTAAYRQARALRERANAERAQVELAQLKGRLVDVADVEQLQFTASRLVRDRVEQVAPRIAAEVHSMVIGGVSILQLEQHIAAANRQALDDAAAAVREIDLDDDAAD